MCERGKGRAERGNRGALEGDHMQALSRTELAGSGGNGRQFPIQREGVIAGEEGNDRRDPPVGEREGER
jgi:hypothetical protein